MRPGLRCHGDGETLLLAATVKNMENKSSPVDRQVKMNAGGNTGRFLPEINNNNKQKRQQRMKPGSLQTGSVPDKSAQIFSKEEIAELRNSLKQNICVKTLQEGFHRSFSELFSLLRRDQEKRAAAEPASDILFQTPLEEQGDKLETIKLHLSLAEQAERTGSWTAVHEQRLSLGRFFSAPEDLWLSKHFYLSCTERQQGSRSRPATEARGCLAELHLRQGELEEARRQAELCIKLAEEGGWLDSSGHPMRLRARQVLWRIFSRLADAPLARADYGGALTLLHQGYRTAKESEDKRIEGEAAYELGLTYQRAGDHDKAKQFFNTYMQICGTIEDPAGLGKAYKAMAKSAESEGNMDETVWCLEKLADISRSNGLQRSLVDAYLCLGDIYYSSRQYERASQYFLQSYEAACNLGDVALMEETQAWVGNACAYAFIRKYSADVTSATPAALKRLLVWKENRGGLELGTDSTDGKDNDL